MRELNQLNKIVMQTFASRQAYTFIKGQYVPIILDNVSDESQMTIDTRKYYVQNYDFIMLGYLIDEEEFEVKPAIQRITQLIEVDTSTRRQRRNRFPKNPDTFNFDFLFTTGDTVEEKIDFTANMNVNSLENVSSFDVYINNDFYGINPSVIQITTNDILRIVVTKSDNTKEAKIIFINNLYGGQPVFRQTNSYSNGVPYTLGVQSGATFNLSSGLNFRQGDTIKLVHNSINYQNSKVVSYNNQTGVLVFSGATNVVGSGTYDTWDVDVY
jgi:hypothetical protein